MCQQLNRHTHRGRGPSKLTARRQLSCNLMVGPLQVSPAVATLLSALAAFPAAAVRDVNRLSGTPSSEPMLFGAVPLVDSSPGALHVDAATRLGLLSRHQGSFQPGVPRRAGMVWLECGG